MSIGLNIESKTVRSSVPSRAGTVLRRKCDCGSHTVAGGECQECTNKEHGLQWSLTEANSSGRGRTSSDVPTMQRKLTIGASDDPMEKEADRVADQVLSMQANPMIGASPPRIQGFTGGTGTGTYVAPTSVDRVLANSGRPLEPSLRRDMEQRFGNDFSTVQVHSNAAAAASSKDVNANAYTVENNIVFGAGQFAPNTREGRRLIAHELAHVAQQSDSIGIHVGQGGKKRGLSSVSRQIQPRLLRQVAPSPISVPTFSVNQGAYLALINLALRQMSGRLVESETLATTILPILHAMLGNVIWKDAQGGVHGGGVVQYNVDAGVTLNLQLILNDAASSQVAGEFTHRGTHDGEMEVFVQQNPTVDELAETLYHEAMHLVSWLINRPRPVLTIPPSARRGRGAAGTLDLSHSTTQIASVRQSLDTLAQSVNLRRTAGAQIAVADLGRMARWLLEEVNVRIETEVFRLAASTQQVLASRGPAIIIGTGTNWRINRDMVDKYVFDFSHVFLPADRATLTTMDQETLANMMQILEGIFQSRVRRRFNPSPYLVGRGIPRAPVQWIPPPLTPPTFPPLPVP